jgi:hypothetical protein
MKFAGTSVYSVETRRGVVEKSPTVDRMEAILAELDLPDPEHPDTWLTHASGWTLDAHETGLLIWEDTESDEPPRHMTGVARATVLALWVKLSQGRIDEIDREPWQPGLGLDPA